MPTLGSHLGRLPRVNSATLQGIVSTRPTTLALLGAGGAFSRRYGTTCAVLSSGSGEKWLIDCGRQAPDQLVAAGISWYDIAGQIITHVHGDHVYGLEDFAFTRYYVEETGFLPVSRGGGRPQFIAHAQVGDEVWAVLAPSLAYLVGPDKNLRAGVLEHYFEVVSALGTSTATDTNTAICNEHYLVEDIRLTLRPVPHVPGKPSCGVEIVLPATDDEDESLVWWSGDSIVELDRLCDFAQRACIVFHDCSFAPGGGAVHADYQALLGVPRQLREKIVLMHHEDDLDGNLKRIAADGFRYALPGDKFDLRTGARISLRPGEKALSLAP